MIVTSPILRGRLPEVKNERKMQTANIKGNIESRRARLREVFLDQIDGLPWKVLVLNAKVVAYKSPVSDHSPPLKWRARR